MGIEKNFYGARWPDYKFRNDIEFPRLAKFYSKIENGLDKVLGIYLRTDPLSVHNLDFNPRPYKKKHI